MATSLSGFKGPTGLSGMGRGSGDVVPKGYEQGKLQQFDSQQMKLYKNLFGFAGPDSYLSKLAGGDEDIFNQIEGPSMKQFNELQGGLASRFSGMGMGGRKSSGFQNMQTAASSNFAQDLSSRRQELQRQAIMDLMGLSQSLLGQRPQEKFLTEKQQKPRSFMEELLLGLSGGAGTALGTWAGNKFGG